MEKVEIVIKIPKYYLTHPQDYTCLAECVRRGVLLPKGHGRLIDASKYAQSLIRYIDENKNSDDMFLAGCGDGAYHAMCMLKDISTIIEAESEGEE